MTWGSSPALVMALDCEDDLSAGMFDFGERFGGPVREDFVGGFVWNVA